MRSIRDMIGKPLIAIDSGDKLGTVADALIEDGTVRLVALVVGGGLMAKEHVLPFSEVQTVGGDTLLARSQSGVVGARDWRDGDLKTSRSSALRGRPVVTVTGRRLGEVGDVLFDERTGAFEALEVAASDLGGLRTRRALVRPGSEIRIGPDAVVVPDDATPEGEDEPAEGEPAG